MAAVSVLRLSQQRELAKRAQQPVGVELQIRAPRGDTAFAVHQHHEAAVHDALVRDVAEGLLLGLDALFLDDTLPLHRDRGARGFFLGEVVKWEGERELLGLGVGIGVVIVALTFFLSLEAGQERVTPGC